MALWPLFIRDWKQLSAYNTILREGLRYFAEWYAKYYDILIIKLLRIKI